MTTAPSALARAALLAAVVATPAAAAGPVFRPDDRVVVVGDTAAERTPQFGYSDAAPNGPSRPLVKAWRMADFAPFLHLTERGRSFERGKALFKEAACAQCHRTLSRDEILDLVAFLIAGGDPAKGGVSSESPKPAAKANGKPPHVVFVTGDEEYRSEESMPLVARILKDQHNFRVTVCYAVAADGTVKPDRLDHIAGLDALKDADLMVMFTRWRNLPDGELKAILDYANSGRPMIGFRTTTHAFRYTQGENAKWNDAFGRDVFGQKWITHHGHEKGEYLTAVKPLEAQKRHPVLRGVGEFPCPSWLYHVEGGGDKLAGDCVPLLEGTSLVSSHAKAKKSDRYPLTQPVAWTKTFTGTAGKPARVFFTTLGHPHDFKSDAMRKLVVNAVYWSLGRETEIPEAGEKAELPGPFDLSQPAPGAHRKNIKPVQP
jgi:type 1 glutamine amidotransferase